MTLFEGHRTHRNAPCSVEPVLDGWDREDGWDDEIEQPARRRGQRVYPHPGEKALLWATNNAHLAEARAVLVRARLSQPRRFTIRIGGNSQAGASFYLRDSERPHFLRGYRSLAFALAAIDRQLAREVGA